MGYREIPDFSFAVRVITTLRRILAIAKNRTLDKERRLGLAISKKSHLPLDGHLIKLVW